MYASHAVSEFNNFKDLYGSLFFIFNELMKELQMQVSLIFLYFQVLLKLAIYKIVQENNV